MSPLLRLTCFALASLAFAGCGFLGIGAKPAAAADSDAEVVAVSDTLSADSASAPKRLPTLREQMKKIEESQVAISSDVSALRRDVSALTKEVQELKQVVESAANKTSAAKGDPTPAATKPKTVTLLPEPEPAAAPKKTQPKPADVAGAEVPKEPKADKEAEKPAAVLKPDSPLPKADVSPAKGEQTYSLPENYRKALGHMRKKEYSEALALFKVVATGNSHPSVRAQAWYWAGEASFAMGNYEAALANFAEVAKLGPSTKSDDALLMSAEAHIRMQNPTAAKKEYQRLLRDHPTSEFVGRAKKMLQML